MFAPALWVQLSLACTTVHFTTSSNDTVVGRTMELAVPFGETLLPLWKLVSYPRGTLRLGKGSDANALGFVVTQIEVGDIAASPLLQGLAPLQTAADGMNEAGLTVACQTQRLAEYQQPAAGQATTAYYEVLPVLLGSCRTVAQAAEKLQQLTVVDTPLADKLFGKFHWSVIDDAGGSMVFEYLDGALRSYDNSQVGVLTNDPDFRYQLQNLNQWGTFPTQQSGVNQRFPFTVSSPIGEVPTQTGHGYNTHFLPGGYAPPDRFVRMFMLKQTAVAMAPPADVDAGIEIATGLLNTVHIIRGTVSKLSASDTFELTHWALAKLPRQRQILFRSYGNMQWKRLSLSSLALHNTSSAPRSIPIIMDGLGIKDIATPHR